MPGRSQTCTPSYKADYEHSSHYVGKHTGEDSPPTCYYEGRLPIGRRPLHTLSKPGYLMGTPTRDPASARSKH